MASWRGHCARRVDRPSTELGILRLDFRSGQLCAVERTWCRTDRAPNESHQLGREAAEIGPQDPNATRLAAAPFAGLSMA